MKLHYFFAYIFLSYSLVSFCVHDGKKSSGHYSQAHNYSYVHNPYHIKKPSLLKKYATSVIPAAIVGGVTGGVCALTEKYIFPFSWFIFPGLRWLIIDALAKDFVESDVPHNKNILLATARIADWAVWLCVIMNTN